MSNRIRLLVVAAMLILASASSVAAQTGAVLSGVVSDQAGSPVPGVVLLIDHPLLPETRLVLTDQQGRYFIDHLDYGTTYTVEIHHPQFRRSQVPARANEGETPIDITVKPRAHGVTAVLWFPLRVLSFGLIGQR